tara:strand:- start:396 stop:980 length:585 start_codon:yes stop_codon:yes gene_type:complete
LFSGNESSVFKLDKNTDAKGNVSAQLFEDGKITDLYLDRETGNFYINGKLSPEFSSVKSNSELYSASTRIATMSVYPGDKPSSSGYSHVGTYNGNVPIGTTISLAAAAISIHTGVPAKKISQYILLGATYIVGVKLDEILYYKYYMYRTDDKVTEGTMIPQYMYKTKTYLYFKSYSNKIAGPISSDWWFANKPY